MRSQNYSHHHPKYENKWKRVNEIFPWIAALDAFDFNDANPLSYLLIGNDRIPDELRPAIGDIVAGRRKPNLKAASKLKIPAADRLNIAAGCSILIGTYEMLREPPIQEYPMDDGTTVVIRGTPNIETIADGWAQEPIEVQRYYQAKIRNVVTREAEIQGVSVETIENLLRDLRRKVENFPNV